MCVWGGISGENYQHQPLDIDQRPRLKNIIKMSHDYYSISFSLFFFVLLLSLSPPLLLSLKSLVYLSRLSHDFFMN